VGALSLFFGTAYQAFLPALIGRAQLVEGNSKLELSRSAAEIVGPGLAGGLVQLVTAPLAILVDAFSFLLSGALLGAIRTPEPLPPAPAESQNIWREIGEGLRLVARNPLLRAMAGCNGTLNLFNATLEAVAILYLSQQLHLSPGWIGFIFAAGGLGFLVGALLPDLVTRRFGLGKVMMGGLLLTGGSDLLTPLAGGSFVVVTLLLITGQFFFGIGLTLFNVAQVSLRQAVTPDSLQGRMNATIGFIAWALVPVGALLGGWLGETIGLRPTLFLSAGGEMLAVLWLLLSPVRAARASEP
jgi:Na+/melibiose symporter-like transporter